MAGSLMGRFVGFIVVAPFRTNGQQSTD